MCDEIAPGSEPSYQVCKTIYLFHPLGAKIAEAPVEMAQSQKREITIQNAPEERVKERFEEIWQKLGADRQIFNVMKLARVYGVSSLAYGVKGKNTNEAIDLFTLPSEQLTFSVFDPLNTAGSLVLSQDPTSANFQTPGAITVDGNAYHGSRCCVVMNESPIYIAYTSSAFGYVGRSVYQRSLFPLKSFVQSMITDDMVTKKAGVLVAKMKMVGSVIDAMMSRVMGVKRALLKEAQTDNVISVSTEEDIQSLDLHNIDSSMTTARKNILENIAAASPMPSVLLNSQTFAQGFGEGTEDAKNVARYIDGIRESMATVYAFMDRLVQHVAWSPEFYAIIQQEFPEEYGKMDYKAAFMRWQNSFKAVWPNLLTEPDSEKVNVDKTKLESIVSVLETLLPQLDPHNKAVLLQWAVDNVNSSRMLFTTALDLDSDQLAEFIAEQQKKLDEAPEAPEGTDTKTEASEKTSEPPAPKKLAAA